MNLLDIAKVQNCITSLSITARSNGVYLHEWIIGEYARFTHSHHMARDIQDGKISLHDLNINWHGTAKGNGLPVMGWGLNGSEIPEELLNAEITELKMQCRNGVTFWVTVDIELQPITAEMIKATF